LCPLLSTRCVGFFKKFVALLSIFEEVFELIKALCLFSIISSILALFKVIVSIDYALIDERCCVYICTDVRLSCDSSSFKLSGRLEKSTRLFCLFLSNEII